MSRIDKKAIDLNLLKTLDALLREGSVTRAARSLGVGQPATSHALNRLRELCEDPLFVRSGRGIIPTPRAEAMREPVSRLLREAARIVAHEPAFDPAQTTRTFTLSCPDLLAPTLGALAARVGRQAPGARLVVRPRRPDDAHALERGETDVVLSPTPSVGPGLVRRGLGRVRFAIHMDAGHPLVAPRPRVTLQAWLVYPQVIVETGHGGSSLVAATLARAGIERRIGLVVPGFLAALAALRGTELTYAAPRELTAPLLETFGLCAAVPPIDLPEVPVAALWHERFTHDPAHRFFRELVRREFEQVISTH